MLYGQNYVDMEFNINTARSVTFICQDVRVWRLKWWISVKHI